MNRVDWPKWACFALIGVVGIGGCFDSVEEPLPPLPDVVPLNAESPRGVEREFEHFSIAFVGAVRGEIEPCGCPTLPWGGFERRWVWLEDLRGEGEPLFHLDAGQLLVKGLISADGEARRTRAEMLLELSQQVGLDAWAPGPGDLLAYGAAEIGTRSDALGVHAISATWLDEAGGLLLPGHVILERSGVRLGVIGLSAPPSTEEQGGVFSSVDPVVAARDAVGAMASQDVDLVVALSNFDDADIDRVASEVDGIAAILSTKNTAFEPFRVVADTLIVEAPDRGRHGSELQLQLGSGPDQPLDGKTSRRVDFATRDELRARIAMSGELAEDDPLLLEFDRREAVWADEGRGRNLYAVQHQALGRSFDRDSNPISVVLDSIKTEELELTERRIEKARTETQTPQYIGNGNCAGCHSGRFARWAAGPHAHAYRELLSREEHLNPECLACHTTAFARIGGWADLTPGHISKFRGVQCEACHGALEGHPDRVGVGDKEVTEVTCLECHDEANSPDFDYASYRKRLACVSGESVPVAGGEQRR